MLVTRKQLLANGANGSLHWMSQRLTPHSSKIIGNNLCYMYDTETIRHELTAFIHHAQRLTPYNCVRTTKVCESFIMAVDKLEGSLK